MEQNTALNDALYILARALELVIGSSKEMDRFDKHYINYLSEELDKIQDHAQNYEY